jgi:hypothetical protein
VHGTRAPEITGDGGNRAGSTRTMVRKIKPKFIFENKINPN